MTTDARADFEAASRGAVREADRLSGATATCCADVPRETLGFSVADYYAAEELGARREVLQSILGIQIRTVEGLPAGAAFIVAPGRWPREPDHVITLRGLEVP